MGVEPKEEDVPKDPSTFSLEAQQALIMLNVLPDKWEGMSGSWLGKEYAGLLDIMDLYQIEDKKQVFELLKVCEDELGKFYAERRKQQEQLSKAKKGR
tara:strand:+ start:2392 stop:2685 length:294 start_codon:yes stop_codon:yes gene_type:complete